VIFPCWNNPCTLPLRGPTEEDKGSTRPSSTKERAGIWPAMSGPIPTASPAGTVRSQPAVPTDHANSRRAPVSGIDLLLDVTLILDVTTGNAKAIFSRIGNPMASSSEG